MRYTTLKDYELIDASNGMRLEKWADKIKNYDEVLAYKEEAAKRDKKLLAAITGGYDTIHLSMGYDGNRDKRVCDAGFANANDIINHCARLMPEPVCA